MDTNKTSVLSAALLAASALVAPAHAGTTFDAIKARGYVQCGVSQGMGKNLGVDDKWAYRIIKQVGNYGESFETHLGMASPMKLERGMNAQWRDGGLMYGWPIR